MNDSNKTRDELLDEVKRLKRLLGEESENGCDRSDPFHFPNGDIDFRQLLQCLPDIVYNIDNEGKFTFVSDYVSVLGYKPEEIVGRHFTELIHPEDVPIVSRSFVLPNYMGSSTGNAKSPKLFDERRGGERITRGMEVRLLVKKAGESGDSPREVFGTVFTNAEVNSCGCYSVIDDKKVFQGTIGIIRDITRRKKSEMDTLRKSEERYKNLVQQSRDAIFQVNCSGVIVLSNPAAGDIFGALPLPGERFEEFVRQLIHPDYLAVFDRFWNHYEKTGSFLSDIGEWAWNRPDGSSVYTEILFSAVLDDEGNVNGFQTMARDITRRKTIEGFLKESEEMFRNLAENSPNMIFITQKSRVVYANRECELVMGYSRRELYGDEFSLYVLIAPESRETVEMAYRSLARGEDVQPYEYVLVCRDGKRIDAINSTKLIKYRGEDALLGVVTDITDRKISEDNVRKAQKLESLGILAGGIAHDFNNILTVIMGNITLSMLNPSDTDLITGNLKAAEEAVGRAKDLTRQFLTLSKSSLPVKKTMHIGEFLKNALSFAISGSAVKKDFQISEDLWPVEIDENQIGQVINNLVINAVQAMPGGGALRLRASNEIISNPGYLPLESGNYVKISLSDTGQGIPEEHISRIFDPYFSTREMGSGLGLAISYSIISKHGGFIDVKSKVGEGSEFIVYLPASSETVRQEASAFESVVSGRGRILVMDDDEGVQAIAEKFLTYLGYDFEIARDGDEALTKYREALEGVMPFSAVILDLTVPGGMSGKETVIKLLEVDPAVKAVLSSGYVNDPVVINYHDHGFRDVITKPYRIDELSRVLHRVLYE